MIDCCCETDYLLTLVDNNIHSVLDSNENYMFCQSQTNQILDVKFDDNVLGNNIDTRSYNSNEEFNIELSMRPSSSTEAGSSSMHELFSSINDTSVNMQPPAVANVYTDNHIHGQDNSCTTDNELISPPDQSLSVTSFQVSNNSTRSTTHDRYVNNSSSMTYQTASQSYISSSILSSNVTHSTTSGQSVISSKEQSNSEYLLDLGLKSKGFQMGHLYIQGLSNKIDQVRLLLQSENNQIHVFWVE